MAKKGSTVDERERQERIDRYTKDYGAPQLAELLVDLEMKCEADALREVRRGRS